MPAIDERTVGSLDRDGPTPLYRQLKWLIRRGIDDGQYRVGDRLPSENDFARTYAVSRHLVRQALLSLVAEGQVVARQGDGYYVNARRVRRELPVLTGYTAAMQRSRASGEITLYDASEFPTLSYILMAARHYLSTRYALAKSNVRPLPAFAQTAYIDLVQRGLSAP